MEISRQLKPAASAQSEGAVAPRKAPAGDEHKAVAASRPAAAALSVEPLQEALANLPDIDLERVEAIKQALQRGDISSDAGALSRSILAYHSGKDA